MPQTTTSLARIRRADAPVRDRDASAACVVAGTVHAVLFLAAALGFAASGWARLAGGAALMGLLLWVASLAHWGMARLAERLFAARMDGGRAAQASDGGGR